MSARRKSEKMLLVVYQEGTYRLIATYFRGFKHTYQRVLAQGSYEAMDHLGRHLIPCVIGVAAPQETTRGA